MQTITGKLIDLFNRRTYPARVTIADGVITSVTETDTSSVADQYLLPGFIDAHIHIESSMLVPTSFAQAAVVHGTVATVSDPHEIANVNGAAGIQYMLDNAARSPFKFFFGAPSCVPATSFETAGATLDHHAVADLLTRPDIHYLSEMMNYPGVLHRDAEVMAKIAAAHRAGKPVDGHAPGLRGADATAYAAAGITTDHECFTLDEALDKIAAGMRIIIREGSAAKNFEALHPLITSHPQRVMLCSDDKHPDELAVSHINGLVKRALQKGHNLYDVLRAACVNPVLHYRIPVGMLRVGDPADLIVVDNTTDLNVMCTYIRGGLVAQHGKSLLPSEVAGTINNFMAERRSVNEFALPAGSTSPTIRVIDAIEGQLVTQEAHVAGRVENGCLVSDTTNDLLKMVVINRYEPKAPIAFAFIRNIGLKQGAIASTVAHDCHNIVATGADDTSLCAAVNALVDCNGGIAAARNEHDVVTLPLPVAGLMSTRPIDEVAAAYTRLNDRVHELGSPLHAPFMTLSFMALLVIPSLKLSDKGLFDGNKFTFTPLEVH
jgi:adenine deaminase